MFQIRCPSHSVWKNDIRRNVYLIPNRFRLHHICVAKREKVSIANSYAIVVPSATELRTLCILDHKLLEGNPSIRGMLQQTTIRTITRQDFSPIRCEIAKGQAEFLLAAPFVRQTDDSFPIRFPLKRNPDIEGDQFLGIPERSNG